MGVHISTRLTLLPRVVDRLTKDVSALYCTAKAYEPEHVFTRTKSGTALPVDNDIKYHVIADVDSFLFEVNACAELMQKFFQLLYAHAGKPITDKEDVAKAVIAVLKKDGVPKAWFKKLKQARNFAAHNGTPYVAIDISEYGKWEALFLKENIVLLDDKRKFFKVSDLQDISHGFSSAKTALQKHLVELFQL